ncbi:MAG: redox-sensing transcriptional repressor Rex [bacterium]
MITNDFIIYTKAKYNIPESTVTRLSMYYRVLSESGRNDFIRSEEIAFLTGFTPPQIRRDLTYFGQFGVPGKGYPVDELKQKILGILGIDKEWKVALIGVGNLGSAFLTYKGFKQQGFKIVAAFDNDRRKIGSVKADFQIQDIKQLKSVVQQNAIKIAILTVPAMVAQEVLNYVVDSGIKLILNFAAVRLKVPDFVNLLNIDIAVELERLTYYATSGSKTLVLKKTLRLFR